MGSINFIVLFYLFLFGNHQFNSFGILFNKPHFLQTIQINLLIPKGWLGHLLQCVLGFLALLSIIFRILLPPFVKMFASTNLKTMPKCFQSKQHQRSQLLGGLWLLWNLDLESLTGKTQFFCVEEGNMDKSMQGEILAAWSPLLKSRMALL